MRKPKAYSIRNKEGQYYSIDKAGSLKTSTAPVFVTGVPDAIQDLSYLKPVTFTGNARNILARIYNSKGGSNALLFVCFDRIAVSLNAASLRVTKDELKIAPDSPDTAKRAASGENITFASWSQFNAQDKQFYYLPDTMPVKLQPVPGNLLPA